MRNLAMACAAFLSATMINASAYSDWRITVWRPAIDAIGNADPPHLEGIATIPDGFDFGPESPTKRGRVIVDDSTTPLPPTVHLRRRKVLVIGR